MFFRLLYKAGGKFCNDIAVALVYLIFALELEEKYT